VNEAGDAGGSLRRDRAELVERLTHELRGPVATLRGLVGTSLRHYDGLDDGERREFLELIRIEADRLERAVEQVALAMKLDAGSVRFDLRAHDLGAIVREAVAAVDVGTHPLEYDVPSVSAPVDATLLAVVVRQLVENAVAYSPPDAPISVRLHTEGRDAVLEVLDAGPGIPPDQREAVFERFAGWRPAGYEDRPGTGLGLFVCREIMREHSGEVWATDHPTGGTMLAVRLPLEERKAADP
jgi:signal transduction histidine kinase